MGPEGKEKTHEKERTDVMWRKERQEEELVRK